MVWSTNNKTCNSNKAIAHSMLAKKQQQIFKKGFSCLFAYFIKAPNSQIILRLSDCNNKIHLK